MKIPVAEQIAEKQLEFSLGARHEERHAGTRRGLARHAADRAVNRIRDRFDWEAIGYGAVTFGPYRSVPDEFRELAEKEL
jgi:DNA polymerase-4